MNIRQVHRRTRVFKFNNTFANFRHSFLSLKSTRLPPTNLTRIHTNQGRHIRRRFSITTIRSIIVINRHSMVTIHHVRSNILHLHSTAVHLISGTRTVISPLMFIRGRQTKVNNTIIRRSSLRVLMQLPGGQVRTMARMFLNIMRQGSSQSGQQGLHRNRSFFAYLHPTIMTNEPPYLYKRRRCIAK